MRKASCQCGQLSAICPDDHLLHAECGCVDCQRRTGTPSSFQVWSKVRDVDLNGEYRSFTRSALTGSTPEFKFCPNCGSTVLVEAPMGVALWGEDIVQVPVGCFFDQSFAGPDVAVWTSGLHPSLRPHQQLLKGSP
ncbi:MAG: GFA family protein [Halioglobus sp.]